MRVWVRINKDDLTDFAIETEGGAELTDTEAEAEYDGNFVLIGPIETGIRE